MSKNPPYGQHATSPGYVRVRKNSEAVIARSEKQEERLARKKAKPVKPETAEQRFEKKIKSLMAGFIGRKKEGKWTSGQLGHREAPYRQRAARTPDDRRATAAPYRRLKRKIKARIAARSRVRNRR